MNLSPIEAHCMDLEGIWINKAQYEDAERKFQVAKVQKRHDDEMSNKVPAKRKRPSKSKKNKSTNNQDRPVDKLVEALRYEAQNWHLNPTQYADAECSMVINEHSKPLESQKRKVDSLTPYQGSRRCFGSFQCKSCNWGWTSANSWANMSQPCRKCEQSVYPYKQRKLDKVEYGPSCDEGMLKQHDATKCEKCKKIGGDCRILRYGFNNQRLTIRTVRYLH